MEELIKFVLENFWQIMVVIVMATYNGPIAALMAYEFMCTNGNPNMFLMILTFVISFTPFPFWNSKSDS